MLLDIVKFRAYHVYFIVLLVSGIIGAYLDLNFAYQSTESPHLNGLVGFVFGIGYALPVSTSVLIGYYLVVYYYRKKKTSKSYI